MIATCPYCGKENDIDLTDIDVEDDYHFLHECSNCGKLFNVTLHVDVTCSVGKCDCQGENHEWELAIAFPKEFSKMRCKHCEEERQLTDEERKQYKIPSKESYIKKLEKLSKESPF